MDYYSALRRNELSNHEKTWRNLKGILLSERSQSEKATYCMILTIWHSGKGVTMETVKRSVVAREEVERKDEYEEHRGFVGQWKYSLWYYNDGYISLYISTEYTTPRVNHKVNYGCAVIMICQRRFILCKICTILLSDVDNEGGYTNKGAGGVWEISVPSCQFCCKPKTALKK